MICPYYDLLCTQKGPSRYLRYMTHILRYTRVPPLFDEMPLATESEERKLYITWVNQSLHGLGKWWTEFTTDEFKFRSVIAFTIGLSQFRVTKNGRESLKLIFKKGLKTWNPNFRLEFSNQENNRMHLFRRSVFFRNFPLKRRKQPETELMVSLVKHQSVLLVCFNGSNIQSCSSFMIRTRFHTSV